MKTFLKTLSRICVHSDLTNCPENTTSFPLLLLEMQLQNRDLETERINMFVQSISGHMWASIQTIQVLFVGMTNWGVRIEAKIKLAVRTE